MRKLATISLTFVLSSATPACNRDDADGPPPAISKLRSQAPADPAPEAPAERPRLTGAVGEALRPPVLRVEGIRSMLVHLGRGEIEPAFAALADDVVWTEVGVPDGQLASREEVIAYYRRSRDGFSDFRFELGRVIEARDYVVAELTWSARHTYEFVDSTPPSGKFVTMPMAMLVHYRVDDRVDRAWVFQDWPQVLQQLGFTPGLAPDFAPATLPDRAEVVIGGDDPALRERYASFLAQLVAGEADALTGRTTDDFVWVDHATGHPLVGRDAAQAKLAERARSFVIESAQIEVAVAAGPWLATFVTNKLRYLGGLPGVVATDQQITTHTLDIVRFDATRERFEMITRYGNSYETLSVLQAGGAPAP